MVAAITFFALAMESTAHLLGAVLVAESTSFTGGVTAVLRARFFLLARFRSEFERKE